MSIFYPDVCKKRVYEVTPQLLESLKIEGLILDIDNTLTTHNNPQIDKQISSWLLTMKQAGIKLVIVSNNTVKRVDPFAKGIEIDYIADGLKPLTSGISKAQKLLNLEKEKLAIVGDQIFTDILGGNLYGITTILVEPMLVEKNYFFKIKRGLEKWVLRRYSCRS